MKTRFGKLSLVLACMLAIVTGAASTSDAGIVPCLWDLLFGPCGGGRCYSRSYSYSAYPVASRCVSSGYCPTTAYYIPGYAPYGFATRGPYGPVYSICGISSCATNVCAVNYQKRSGKNAGLVPDPEEAGLSKTFTDEADKAGKTEEERDDEGFRLRKSGTKPEPKEPVEIEAFKKTAPIPPPVEGETKSNDADAEKPDAKKSTKPGSSRLQVPLLNFDEKVTWRVVPKRSRLSLRANFVSPTIARRKLKLNADWMPVPEHAKLVKK